MKKGRREGGKGGRGGGEKGTETEELQLSEYFSDVAPGQSFGGIECQDVESLTYGDERFDLCTSTDVFEHVADDRRGFSELYRVLRPGGRAIFTVPINVRALTVERARRTTDGIEHFLEAEYHGDTLRGPGRVLAFRNYGGDIRERLSEAGFRSVELNTDFATGFLGFGRTVVVARK